MPYLIAGLILSGLVAGYVAGRKGRSRIAWMAVGMFLPGLGILLSIAVPERGDADGSPEGGAPARKAHVRRRPRRCCGSWIPDCQGCDWFHRELFRSSQTTDSVGYCEYYGRRLAITAAPPNDDAE